jgi:PadR family transcriptional regulator PadR
MRKKEGFLLNAGPSLMILAMLRERARYGVDIALELERITEAELSFQPGTLYPMLHHLQKQGLVVSEWAQPNGERARRMYCLTDKGKAEIESMIGAWEKYTRAVERVLQETANENA